MVRRFSDPVEALEYLLDVSERNPEQKRVLAYPDYGSMATEDQRATFHRVIEGAEESKSVTIKRDKHAGPADIRFISLSNACLLADHLQRTPASQAAKNAYEELCKQIGSLSEWAKAILEEVYEGWKVRREAYPGLSRDDVPTVAKFFNILSAIDRGDHLNGWDMRTFSRRACGDSKAVEKGMARLVKALRTHYELPDTTPQEALAAFGIEKFPQPILIRAKLRSPSGQEIAADPYIGLPPDWVTSFVPLGDVPYVLIIENLASFNRHAREVNDAGVVIFSGGFPSRSALQAIRRLDGCLPTTVPFFHWGDTDLHGYIILSHIDASIERELIPHLMDTKEIEQEEVDPTPPCK